MERKYALMTIVIILAAVFAAGTLLGEQKIDVNGCTAKWSIVDSAVGRSQLCPQDSCIASPEAQQHNAVVDAIMCACGKASSAQYSYAAANQRIEEVTSNFFGFSLTAQQICDDPGRFMTKRSYE